MWLTAVCVSYHRYTYIYDLTETSNAVCTLSGRNELLRCWRGSLRTALVGPWTHRNTTPFAFCKNRLPAIRKLPTSSFPWESSCRFFCIPSSCFAIVFRRLYQVLQICGAYSASKERSSPVMLNNKVPTFVNDHTRYRLLVWWQRLPITIDRSVRIVAVVSAPDQRS